MVLAVGVQWQERSLEVFRVMDLQVVELRGNSGD